MPKVIYTAAKGLYQTSGTGFEIQDVVLSPSSVSVSSDTTLDAVGAILVDVSGGNVELTLNNGSAAGQECMLIVTDDGNDLTEVSSGLSETPTAGDVFVLVWTGSAWVQLT